MNAMNTGDLQAKSVTYLAKIVSFIPFWRFGLSGLLTLLALGGCVNPQPLADDVAELGVAEARQGGTTARTVRWGGTIVDVQNTDASTRLEILSRPLRSNGRPVRDDRTEGRFLARINEFLDPEIYSRGRDITVTGKVRPAVEGQVDEAAYMFAVVEVGKYQFWKPEPPVVRLPPGYYPNRLHRHSSDWPFDDHRYRPRPHRGAPVLRESAPE